MCCVLGGGRQLSGLDFNPRVWGGCDPVAASEFIDRGWVRSTDIGGCGLLIYVGGCGLLIWVCVVYCLPLNPQVKMDHLRWLWRTLPVSGPSLVLFASTHQMLSLVRGHWNWLPTTRGSPSPAPAVLLPLSSTNRMRCSKWERGR